jgi:hypothetical protein
MRVVVVLVSTVAAVLFLAPATLTDHTAPPRAPAATYGQLARLADGIDRDREALATEGVFLDAVGVGDGCAFVSLFNPSAANVAYIHRRFPGACVDPHAGSVADLCDGVRRGSTRDGPVIVPDVGELGMVEASRRVLAAHLTFTASCPGSVRTVEWVPARPADDLVRVVAQCPRAGQRVRRGTEVALQAETVLPGGFGYVVGAPGHCEDGRNLEN